MINRRGLITGLISFVAAPAIVRASSLMPIRVSKLLTLTNYNDLILHHTSIDFLYGHLFVRPEWLTFLGDEVIKLIPEHYNT